MKAKLKKCERLLPGGIIYRSHSKVSISFLKEGLWELVESAVKSGRLDDCKEDLVRYRKAFDASVNKLLHKAKEIYEERFRKNYA